MIENSIINVLYVDDEVHNLEAFRASFRKDFNIFTALSAKEAEVILDSEKNIHILITDQRLPIKIGTELLADAVKKYPNQTRIILTAFPEDKAVKEAEEQGLIFRYIGKPWNHQELKEYIIEGYDMFYKYMHQKELVSKLKQINKELNKPIKKSK